MSRRGTSIDAWLKLGTAMAILGVVACVCGAGEIERRTDEKAGEFARRCQQSLAQELPKETGLVLERFLNAYPEEIRRVFVEKDAVSVQMAHGNVVVLEDFKKKDYTQRIESPDLADTLHDDYPAALESKPWPENFDPGRYRCDPFLKAVYGNNEAEVRANLVTVPFLGQSVSFNRRNGAADALRKVSADLAELAKADQIVKPYVSKLGGTFNWRPIAGTQRLSAHSYGISIDLNPDLGGYWQWESAADRGAMKRRLAYPAAIIAAFERHGFIWGGKWYHFDLMHFEYRPELLNSAPPK